MVISHLEGEPTCQLSIVVPAYNEEKRLPDSMPQMINFVRKQDYPIEVIIVNDGSTDRTAEVVKGFQRDSPFIALLQVDHGGKGHAVRAGMLQAKGEYLFLCDSDLSMPIEEINKFLPPTLSEYDVAIASREIKGANRYDEPSYRHLMGRVFNLIVRLLAVPGIQDTQAGFKCFRREAARQVFRLQTIKGWGFDVETLFIAQRRGMVIVEVPINWYYNNRSQVKPIQDTYNMFLEVLKVRFNGWQGRYG
ncbi:MAG: glycosyltransferase family 2 protein [Chloroflexi bacterium]|nr:glycosyltransferase family 2 protein [Chloroflexota bacterium]